MGILKTIKFNTHIITIYIMNIYNQTMQQIFYEIDIINVSTTLFRLIQCDVYNIKDYDEYFTTLKTIIDETYIYQYSIELEKLLFFETDNKIEG